MSEEPTTEALRLAQEARRHAEQAAEDLDHTRVDDDAMADEDVEARLGRDLDPPPHAGDGQDSDITGPGSPAP